VFKIYIRQFTMLLFSIVGLLIFIGFQIPLAYAAGSDAQDANNLSSGDVVVGQPSTKAGFPSAKATATPTATP